MKIQKENTGKKDIFQRFSGSRIGSLLFLGLSTVLIYNVVRSIVITSEKLEILNQAEEEVGELRLENLELLTLTEYMTSDEYLETEARNRLNLSKKGETTFVIPEEMLGGGVQEVEEILNSEEVITEGRSIEVWYEFFLNGI